MDSRRRRRRILRACTLAALATVTAACDDRAVEHERKAKRRRECNQFVVQLNAASKELVRLTGKRSRDEVEQGREDHRLAEKRRKIAAVYSGIVADIDHMKIADPTLAEHVADYRKLCVRAAAKATEIADALAKGEGKRAHELQSEFNRVVARENAKISEINGFCSR